MFYVLDFYPIDKEDMIRKEIDTRIKERNFAKIVGNLVIKRNFAKNRKLNINVPAYTKTVKTRIRTKKCKIGCGKGFTKF
jgi:hypothetical protein